MSLKAVIFDMDGVLCATDEFHYRSWKQAVSDYGIPFNREDNEKLLGLTRPRSLEVLLDGRTLPEEEQMAILQRKNEYFLELVEKMGPQDMLAGVERLIEEIRQAGLKIGVASASRNVRAVLSHLGILPLIDAYRDGNTVHRSKPAPDVYLATAEALGVEPVDCLVVEDSQAGVQAALHAGMWVVGVGPAERVGLAHGVYSSLEQVYLARLVRIAGNH